MNHLDDNNAQPIHHEDIQQIVRIIGRVAGMMAPLPERKRALMDDLSALLDAPRWLWVTSAGFCPGTVPTAIGIASGGFTPEEMTALVAASQDPDAPVPENAEMIREVCEIGHVTRTRSDWIADDKFYEHPQWRLYRRRAGSDHYLFSIYPLGDGYVSGIGLHRPPGAPDFDVRERRIMHLVIANVEWLHWADVPERTNDRTLELTPRLRTVMMLMLQGMNRREIADNLGISPNTTAGYQKQIYRHFDVRSQHELVSRFITGDGGDAR